MPQLAVDALALFNETMTNQLLRRHNTNRAVRQLLNFSYSVTRFQIGGTACVRQLLIQADPQLSEQRRRKYDSKWQGLCIIKLIFVYMIENYFLTQDLSSKREIHRVSTHR